MVRVLAHSSRDCNVIEPVDVRAQHRAERCCNREQADSRASSGAQGRVVSVASTWYKAVQRLPLPGSSAQRCESSRDEPTQA